jgi:hypothetical protein
VRLLAVASLSGVLVGGFINPRDSEKQVKYVSHRKGLLRETIFYISAGAFELGKEHREQ